MVMEEPKGRRSKYPWERWSGPLPEGKAWMVTRFLDYHCESRSFATQIYKVAAERGQKVTVQVYDNYVVFAFFDADSFWKPNMPALKTVKQLRKRLKLDGR